MKVMIYKLDDGTMDALVLASPGKGKGPVLLKGVTAENIEGALLPVVLALRGPRVPVSPGRE